MSDDIKFDASRLIEISNQVFQSDALENMQHYNDEMTISQVVRFFERRGIDFTKTMIQNYVRVNVMPPPVDKRHYIKDHLILLTLINNLKNIYSLDDIKKLFTPILKDISTFDDDMIDMNTIYDIYLKSYEASIEDWKSELPALVGKISGLVDESVIHEHEKDTVRFFMTILTLMAQSIATKQYVKLLLEEFINDGGENHEV